MTGVAAAIHAEGVVAAAIAEIEGSAFKSVELITKGEAKSYQSRS